MMGRSILRTFLVSGLALCLSAIACIPDLCEQNAPPSYKELSFDPISWPEPQVEAFTLNNGIRFFLIEDNELPLIQVQVSVRSGTFRVPRNKTGLAEIAGEVMRSGGSEQYSPQELNRLLANKAAAMETSFDFISGSAGMSALREDFRDLLPVFVDVLKRPAFPADRIALAKQHLKTQIRRRNDEQSSIAIRTYKRLIYGRGSIYSREPEYETVDNIDRKDLVRFHRRAYQGANLLVGIVGDFDSKAIRPLLEREFAAFPAGEKSKMDLPAVKNSLEPSLNVVGKQDVNQSCILMGHLGGRRQNPDYAALQVMNRILTGGFSGRLFQKIRTEMGLAYSVFGRYGCNFFYPGMFYVGLKTKTASTAEAIKVVKKELERLRQGISSDELDQAKAQFFNSLVFRYDRSEEILQRHMYYAYREIGVDSFRKLTRNIRRVTPEDVVRVAREYVRPDSLTVLAVGEKEKLVQQLQELGELQVLPQP
jgi:predicted Zn-dependent peptidase